jgi:hypothetical protein
MYIGRQSLGISVGREDFTTFKVNSTLNHVMLLLRRRKEVGWRQGERTTKTCIEEGEAKRKEG